LTNAKYILQTVNLSNSYLGTPLLQNVNLEVSEGEIVCLLGPSGSGKTTLLRIIAGLNTNFEGSVYFRNKDILNIPPHKRGFGMMFQEYALFPHKNVEENVRFGLEMQKKTPSRIKQRTTEMIEMVGLSGYENRRIDELSGGERQRVALARSLAPNPKMILLDEPLGSLDRSLRERLAVEIRSILKSVNVTAIVVTHDQMEAFSIADKVAVLHDGIMEQVSSPENIYRQPQTLKTSLFLGFTNHLNGEIDAKTSTFKTAAGDFPIPEGARSPSSPQKLLIRPEGAVLDSDNLLFNNNRISLRGTVKRVSYQGATYKVLIQIGEDELTFHLPLDPKVPDEGTGISLSVPIGSLSLIETGSNC